LAFELILSQDHLRIFFSPSLISDLFDVFASTPKNPAASTAVGILGLCTFPTSMEIANLAFCKHVSGDQNGEFTENTQKKP
jgi:hypothetical protein